MQSIFQKNRILFLLAAFVLILLFSFWRLGRKVPHITNCEAETRQLCPGLAPEEIAPCLFNQKEKLSPDCSKRLDGLIAPVHNPTNPN
jgi:hypothetical protein